MGTRRWKYGGRPSNCSLIVADSSNAHTRRRVLGHWRAAQNVAGISLCRAEILTGRMHQVRAHLKVKNGRGIKIWNNLEFFHPNICLFHAASEQGYYPLSAQDAAYIFVPEPHPSSLSALTRSWHIPRAQSSSWRASSIWGVPL